jgi:hypothetical protein
MLYSLAGIPKARWAESVSVAGQDRIFNHFDPGKVFDLLIHNLLKLRIPRDVDQRSELMSIAIPK